MMTRGWTTVRTGKQQGNTNCRSRRRKRSSDTHFNQPRRTQHRLEERLQSVDRAWWRDVKILRSKGVPWRVECRRIVEQVYSVFCFGSENWSWRGAILDRMKGREATRRLFRFMRKDDETVTGFCSRTARAARTISNKMKLPFLFEMIAGNIWSAMGWTCDSKPNAVLIILK